MAAAQIRALVVTSHGGPEVLEIQDRPMPEPGPDEVVIEVAAAGVNYVDVYQRIGRYPLSTPFVLGGECAGRVGAAGPDVADIAVGD
jgi:NADPH2:quinone reductase